jgi:hypothetical protein
MKKDPHSAKKPESTPLALEKAEKGSHRSMWELLLQLRVLLPYLTRLVPLIEPLLDRATQKHPALPDISGSITALETGSRDLEVQARNQALQLERIEQQMARLRTAHESSIEEGRILAAEVQALRRRLTIGTYVIGVLLLAIGGMTGFLLFR